VCIKIDFFILQSTILKNKKRMLSITDLPSDIHDTIAAFLPDKDLIEFVCASRQIVVSAYLLHQRQRAHWTKCGVETLAKKGDLAGLQYLHGCGAPFAHSPMDWAAANGHLAVVEFLHSIGATCTHDAMTWAAWNGHLAVVVFLHGIGAPCSPNAMSWAQANGHLAMIKFLNKH
jgi:hypothetical protein